MNKEENKEVVESLFRLCNRMGNDRVLAEAFKDQLIQEHRTLQQSFFRVIKEVIDDYATRKTYDLRNEDSILWTKAVKNAGKDHYLRFI